GPIKQSDFAISHPVGPCLCLNWMHATVSAVICDMKLLGLVLLAYLVLQSPLVRPPAQQAAKSTIAGVVGRAGSMEPIAGAKVSVLVVGGPAAPLPFANSGTRSATTDNDGKFTLKDLEAGQYRVVAARNGYARQEYGQRAIARPGIVLNVLANQSVR